MRGPTCLKQGPGFGPDCVRQTDGGQDLAAGFLLLDGEGKLPVIGGIDVWLAHQLPEKPAMHSLTG